MTTYEKCQMSFSDPQLIKLAKGFGVRVPHSNLTGKHTVLLTKRQCNKVSKCKKIKNGMIVRLSPTQVRHNVKHGGSIAEVIDRIRPFAKTALKAVGPLAIDALSNLATKKYKRSKPIIDGISSLLKKRLNGLGAKRKRRGKGWLSWLTEPVGDALKDVVKPVGEIARENPELTQIAMNAAMKSAMGGRGIRKRTGGNKTTGGFFGFKDILGSGKAKRKTIRKKAAGSFIPPGY